LEQFNALKLVVLQVPIFIQATGVGRCDNSPGGLDFAAISLHVPPATSRDDDLAAYGQSNSQPFSSTTTLRHHPQPPSLLEPDRLIYNCRVMTMPTPLRRRWLLDRWLTWKIIPLAAVCVAVGGCVPGVQESLGLETWVVVIIWFVVGAVLMTEVVQIARAMKRAESNDGAMSAPNPNVVDLTLFQLVVTIGAVTVICGGIFWTARRMQEFTGVSIIEQLMIGSLLILLMSFWQDWRRRSRRKG
jgi:hypothetical protein